MRSSLHHHLRPMAWLVVLIAVFANGCAGQPASDMTLKEPQPAPRPVGGDRDAHGCLAPAGYMWCARERACVRPWELAKQADFDNTAEGFAAHCAAADRTTTP